MRDESSSDVVSGPRCIAGLIHELADRFAESPAIIAPGRRPLSYRALARHVQRVAIRLAEAGIGAGDCVALALPDGPEMAAAFLAVASLARCAPLNPTYKRDELVFYLGDLNARAIVVCEGMERSAIEAARARGTEVLPLYPDFAAEAGLFEIDIRHPREARQPPRFAGAEDVALVLHTSGTTSRPKIVPLTHANLIASAHQVRSTLDLRVTDRCLNIMPLFHIHGLVAALLASMQSGGCVACCPAFDAARFFDWLALCRPTWYTAVPTMHQAILERGKGRRDVIAESPLRFIRSSSSALPPTVLTELERAFAVPVVEAYGMTEAAHQIASNPLPPGTRKPGTVGLAAGPEVAIMGETGGLLPTGTIGEIVIRGPNVTGGYLDNPEANHLAFTDGWFRTGDEGHLDPDGYLTITGRLKEMINRGGEKIAPREVDEARGNSGTMPQAAWPASRYRSVFSFSSRSRRDPRGRSSGSGWPTGSRVCCGSRTFRLGAVSRLSWPFSGKKSWASEVLASTTTSSRPGATPSAQRNSSAGSSGNSKSICP
jgi:oxalate---CoA ligase